MSKPKNKKWIVPTLPPRNPFVVAAKNRKAGSHRPTHKSVRAQQKKELNDWTKTAIDHNRRSDDSFHSRAA